MAGLIMLWQVVEEFYPNLLAAAFLQFTHYWMVNTPYREGFIDRNADSASINNTIKKVWVVTVDAFAHFWGRKFYDRYSIWFCKNNTDLLNLLNKTISLPNQASWTVFSPSNSVSLKVISVLQM